MFVGILSGAQIKNENGAQVRQQKRWLQFRPSAAEDRIILPPQIAKSITSHPKIPHKSYWRRQTGGKIRKDIFSCWQEFKRLLLGTEIVAKSSAGHRVGVGGPPPSCVLSPACAVQPVCTTGGVPCNRNTRLTGCRSAAAVDVSFIFDSDAVEALSDLFHHGEPSLIYRVLGGCDGWKKPAT